jgi:haloacetate dehalogenase
MWARANKAFGLGAYHWFLFAQPYDLPERLLSADPDYFLDWTLRKMAKDPGCLSDEALAAYRAAFRRPEVRHAMMQDYRAGATVDHEHDLADRAAGRVLDCPVLVLWEEGRTTIRQERQLSRTVPNRRRHLALGLRLQPKFDKPS